MQEKRVSDFFAPHAFSLHTHTIGFDGQNSVASMVVKAKRYGWECIGISNHFIVHPNICEAPMYKYAVQGNYHQIYSSSFDEVMEKFLPHYAEIDELRERTGFKIYKGMEVDFFTYDGWRDNFLKAVEILKPDYLIGSAHFIDNDGKLLNSHDWKNASNDLQDELVRTYWANIRSAASSGLFSFLAHLDLPKKTGVGLDDKWVEEEQKTIDVIALNNQIVEINTSALNSRDEAYPANRIISMIAKKKVEVVFSDDAHKAESLGQNYGKAKIITQGLTKFASVDDILQRRIRNQKKFILSRLQEVRSSNF